ncbi:DUF5411 family protein [Holdemania massiliensis]|uniref:DUF5411 family protein n=1 Tax=Holdemania massiliensis TaxID=1468449 RepID=UPI001F06929E|nr:DUF5411 family protein [Holdemania massiliensis]MCH1942440.1 DUF5411 family protein [Holdemania massiliensis]
MSGAIAYYGLVLLSLILIFTAIDFNNKITADDDVHSTTRTTQISSITEAVNLGDLFSSGKLSIDQSQALDLWLSNFQENKDINLKYQIDILGVSEEPPGIAVRVRGYSTYLMLDTDLIVDYTNIIIIDDKEG